MRKVSLFASLCGLVLVSGAALAACSETSTTPADPDGGAGALPDGASGPVPDGGPVVLPDGGPAADSAPPPVTDGAPPPADGGPPGPANVVGLGGIAAWSALPASERNKLKTLRTLFLHQSVGQDLENGAKTQSDPFRFSGYSSGSTARDGLNGGIFRGFGVDNGNPTQKVGVWQAESIKPANALRVAMMKYGYADVMPPILQTAQNGYLAAVNAIKARGIKVLHVTPPLVFDSSENPAKMQMRTWMIATFPGDVIFDLQDIESTSPTNGARCQVGAVWHICQEMRSRPGCVSDQSGPNGDDPSQGHLCPTQATRIAPAFLYAIYSASK